MKLTAVDEAFDVAESTGQGKSALIRKLLKIEPLDPAWSLRRQLDKNPTAWMIPINGFLVDARILKPEIQAECSRKGLIPYIPEDPRDLIEDDDYAAETSGHAISAIPVHDPPDDAPHLDPRARPRRGARVLGGAPPRFAIQGVPDRVNRLRPGMTREQASAILGLERSWLLGGTAPRSWSREGTNIPCWRNTP